MLNNLPPVLKNLLIINVLFFLGTFAFQSIQGTDLSHYLGMHNLQSDLFKPYQFVTYMFLHANLQHLFFNMFGLFMFGRILEQVWGSKRFLNYYLITGIGAAVIQALVLYIETKVMMAKIPTETVDMILRDGADIIKTNQNYVDVTLGKLNGLLNAPTIGASGAIFGILLAYGMLFPNTEMFLMFIPIPIKAKYMVIGYGLLELFSGFSGAEDGVAHFAHLGGMLFGFFLVRYWRNKSNNFY
jgi:membrane associated rhomboid family serine protease